MKCQLKNKMMKTKLILLIVLLPFFSLTQDDELIDFYFPIEEAPIPDSEKVYDFVSVNPEYAGGFKAMQSFIKNNIRYDSLALIKNGTVYVQCVINEDSTINEVKVIKGLTKKANLEAKRIVSIMPKWAPGLKEGVKPVKVRYTIAVKFVLPEEFIIYNIVGEMPSFIGGEEAMNLFIQSNFRYDLIKLNTIGLVYVRGVINRDSTLSEIEALKGVSTEVDSEIIRIINSVSKWNPGKNDGKIVNCRYVIPVIVSLDCELALQAYLNNNFIYPKKINKKGVVSVSFYMEEDGSATNIKIKKSLHKLVKKEIIRVLETLPKKTIEHDVEHSKVKYCFEFSIKKPEMNLSD